MTRSAILTSPTRNGGSPFKTLELKKLPLFVDLQKIEAEPLLKRLRESSLHQIDMSCSESWKAFERLQSACQASGIKLVVEPEVNLRVSKKVPALYLVYLENVAPQQVTWLLQTIDAEEDKAQTEKKEPRQFDSVLVETLDDTGRKQLADALGVRAATLAPAKTSAKAGAGQGSAADEPAKNGSATAIALVYQPSRGRRVIAREIKPYLDARQGWQPGMVHVVLLLRPSRG